jgi:hypothetical protein
MRVGEEWVRKDRAARPTYWAVGLLYWARGPEEREAWAEKCFSFSKMNY